MARRKKQRSRDKAETAAGRHAIDQAEEKPLLAARLLSTITLLLGAMMLFLGVGVLTGMVKEGWGFPMSPVPNWGEPWGAVLALFAIAYIVGPILLFVRPERGSILMMIVAGLSVLVGTPVIQSSAEIFYNLFQDTKSRPDWVDAVWGYFIILHIAICVALYRAYPPPASEADPTPTP